MQTMTIQIRTKCRHLFQWIGACLVLALFSACEENGSSDSGHDFGDNDANVFLAIGDSITEGNPGVSFVPILSAMVGKRGINAGTGGETSGQGAARAPGLIARYKPGYVVILFGSNDAIMGLSADSVVPNLRRIVSAAKNNQSIPVLATVPPMFGARSIFTPRARLISAEIRTFARSESIPLIDLEKAFGDRSDLFLSDGLHPNAQGADLIAKRFASRL